MNELQVVGTDHSIPAKLDVAKRALAEATEDWQRIDIRDYARAVAAATAILERKDIQVQAANLVQDAERAIAKANPAIPIEETRRNLRSYKATSLGEVTTPTDKKEIENAGISIHSLRDMRKAHKDITDEEFEAKKAEAVETGTPLTRSALVEEGRQKRIEKQREEVREERELLIAEPPELPEDQYRTIIIDPPWPMEKIEREVRPNQAGFDYPTMSIEEIKAMDLPIADDAFVFLWTTQKFLPSAFRIMEDWKLKYRFTMVWHKNGGIQPYNSAQFNCEFVVVGSKGNPIFADLKAFKTAFNAPRQGHSIKPDEFYDLIRRVTLSPRLDMFSRREIEGFDVWGHEAC